MQYSKSENTPYSDLHERTALVSPDDISDHFHIYHRLHIPVFHYGYFSIACQYRPGPWERFIVSETSLHRYLVFGLQFSLSHLILFQHQVLRNRTRFTLTASGLHFHQLWVFRPLHFRRAKVSASYTSPKCMESSKWQLQIVITLQTGRFLYV